MLSNAVKPPVVARPKAAPCPFRLTVCKNSDLGFD